MLQATDHEPRGCSRGYIASRAHESAQRKGREARNACNLVCPHGHYILAPHERTDPVRHTPASVLTRAGGVGALLGRRL